MTKAIDVRFFFRCSGPHRHLHSFPTRRSSDLMASPSTGDSHVTPPVVRSTAATVPVLVPTIAYQPAPLMSVSTAPPVAVLVLSGGVKTRVPSVVVVSTTPPPVPPHNTPPRPSTVGSGIPVVLEV